MSLIKLLRQIEGIPGIPNEFATKLVLMLMGFMITLILLCLFLLITIYIYYKEKEEVFGNNKIGPTSVKIDKVHSPYIITPEQKITQQLLASQVVTPIECSVNDIAQLVQYLALHGHFSEDEIYRTPRTFIRLVPRRKTKFDEEELPGKLDHNGGTERSQKKDNIADHEESIQKNLEKDVTLRKEEKKLTFADEKPIACDLNYWNDKEFIEAEEQEGRCPSYFWYFIGSFGLTMVIVLVLIAYLVMYSDHFVWALRRNPNPVGSIIQVDEKKRKRQEEQC
uniref:Uncharacterized protein n=1 Tax=Setaria digitata TaxID=48799 RepID=A0A915PTG8_9BILA